MLTCLRTKMLELKLGSISCEGGIRLEGCLLGGGDGFQNVKMLCKCKEIMDIHVKRSVKKQ